MKMILAKISKHGQSLEDFECVRAVPVKPTFHLFTWEGMSHPSVGGWGGVGRLEHTFKHNIFQGNASKSFWAA